MVVVGVLLPIVPLLYASVQDRADLRGGGVFTLSAVPATVRRPRLLAGRAQHPGVRWHRHRRVGGPRRRRRGGVHPHRHPRRAGCSVPTSARCRSCCRRWASSWAGTPSTAPAGYATNFITRTLHIPLNLTSVPGMAVLGTVVAHAGGVPDLPGVPGQRRVLPGGRGAQRRRRAAAGAGHGDRADDAPGAAERRAADLHPVASSRSASR